MNAEKAAIARGRTHDLWIGKTVLTISLPGNSASAFGPDANGAAALTGMIRDLSRAAKSVMYHAENDTSGSSEFLTWPIEGISDAIILLSQLAEAMNHELRQEAALAEKMG